MTHPFQNKVFRVYSSIFSVLILILLISFVSVPNFNLSAISTNFRWRRDLINFYASLRLNLGDRIYNNAMVGDNSWVFYTGENSISDYQNMENLKLGKLVKLQKNLDRLNKDLGRQGITLLVVIPPNKSTIYPQYMPEQIPIIGHQSRLDQFLEYMELNGDTFVLDLRPTLLEASRSRNVYYKTDTHWNDVGAYYGYVEILHSLVLDYPQLAPHAISDFEYTYAGDSVHDLPLLMGLSNYTEENWALIPNFEIQLKEEKIVLRDGRYVRTITNTDEHLPELLVFGDSFYGSLAHFIEPHFSRVKTVPFTVEDGIWSLDWIRRENPDIVIIEIVERDLDISLPILLNH
jgi:alginate O-acetyltransferase complex protein AlgJ